jgi:general secretion pathway protein K
MMRHFRNQGGIALVVTLLAVVLITSMVVEFSYGVYTGTNNLYNWRDSQRLSIMAKSGINVSARFLSDWLAGKTFSYPGSMDFPVENPFEDFSGTIMVRIEDESSKFNINSIVRPNGILNESAYNSFKRLLKNLSMDEKIADRVADWLDQDSEPRLSDSEVNAKNSALASVDELLMINGISRKDYDTLMPYVTVYGTRDNLVININGAEKPVLRCLSDKITDDLAQRVIDYRKSNPFLSTSDLGKVHGFENDLGIPSGVMTVKGTDFYIKSVASSGGVKRIIETVFNTGNAKIEYWKEY